VTVAPNLPRDGDRRPFSRAMADASPAMTSRVCECSSRVLLSLVFGAFCILVSACRARPYRWSENNSFLQAPLWMACHWRVIQTPYSGSSGDAIPMCKRTNHPVTTLGVLSLDDFRQTVGRGGALCVSTNHSDEDARRLDYKEFDDARPSCLTPKSQRSVE